MSTTEAPSPVKRLDDLLRSERDEIGTILLYAGAVGLLSLAVPVATQALVNTAGFGTLLQPLLVLSALVLLALTVTGVLRALQVIVAERLQQRLFALTAIDLAHRLPRARYEAYDRHRGTKHLNRLLDVIALQKNTTFLRLDGTTILLPAAVGMVLRPSATPTSSRSIFSS